MAKQIAHYGHLAGQTVIQLKLRQVFSYLIIQRKLFLLLQHCQGSSRERLGIAAYHKQRIDTYLSVQTKLFYAVGFHHHNFIILYNTNRRSGYAPVSHGAVNVVVQAVPDKFTAVDVLGATKRKTGK